MFLAGFPAQYFFKWGKPRPHFCLFSFLSNIKLAKNCNFYYIGSRIIRVQDKHSNHFTTTPVTAKYYFFSQFATDGSYIENVHQSQSNNTGNEVGSLVQSLSVQLLQLPSKQHLRQLATYSAALWCQRHGHVFYHVLKLGAKWSKRLIVQINLTCGSMPFAMKCF